MANSYKEYDTTGTGANGLGQTTFSVPFKFININDINALGFNGTTWTPLTISSRGTTSVTLSATPTSGSYNKVRIYRATSSDQLVDFQAGARLSESDLDTAYQQGLFAAQEVLEDASTSQFDAVRDASITSGTTLANFASQAFTATSNQTEFNLTTFTPQTAAAEAFVVSIDGAIQSPTDAYTVSMSPAKITLTSAAPTGSKVVVVTAASAASATAVDDSTLEVVTATNKIQVKDGGITNAKLAGGIPTSKLTGIIDDDTMSTGVTSTSVSSSESIKAYVDNNSIGVGQSWSDERTNRQAGVSYQNTTGRPIMVAVSYAPTGNSTQQIQLSADNSSFVTIANLGFDASESASSFIVPNNHYYRTVGVLAERTWAELR